ncbi:hypothetical protein LEN26_019550 [Aphanomyces euteiches]|nr:hypothetical protein LEN26_019550 [Aphanomyces euteiches]KAH9124137.1 hypothetical protein AeMF1_005043 [Aphanomyces euteiches]
MMDDPILNAPTVDEYGDPSWGPVVLCHCITWKEFERWLKHNEGRIRRWAFEPLEDGTDNGQVVIYSLPTETHERTAHASIAQSCGKSVVLETTMTLTTVYSVALQRAQLEILAKKLTWLLPPSG